MSATTVGLATFGPALLGALDRLARAAELVADPVGALPLRRIRVERSHHSDARMALQETDQVGEPAPLRDVVGVTDLVADGRAFSADVATLSHVVSLRGSASDLPDARPFYSMIE